jgi:hypothetical protein
MGSFLYRILNLMYIISYFLGLFWNYNLITC